MQKDDSMRVPPQRVLCREGSRELASIFVRPRNSDIIRTYAKKPKQVKDLCEHTILSIMRSFRVKESLPFDVSFYAGTSAVLGRPRTTSLIIVAIVMLALRRRAATYRTSP